MPLPSGGALWIRSGQDPHVMEGALHAGVHPIPPLTLVLDLDSTLVDHHPHINAEMACVHYWGKAGVSEEDVWVRPGIRDFLRLLSPYFRMRVVTKSYARRARAILQRLDPEREHVLRGCPPLRADLQRVERGAAQDRAEVQRILRDAAHELEKAMEGRVFVPQHICQFAGKEYRKTRPLCVRKASSYLAAQVRSTCPNPVRLSILVLYRRLKIHSNVFSMRRILAEWFWVFFLTSP